MRSRHPAVLLGAWIARHIEVRPIDYDAISALLAAEAQKEAEEAEGIDALESVLTLRLSNAREQAEPMP